MVDSDDLYSPMEVDDDLSTALGTETLADRDIVTPWLRQHPPGSSSTGGEISDSYTPQFLYRP
jgi:hypothetical protein